MGARNRLAKSRTAAPIADRARMIGNETPQVLWTRSLLASALGLGYQSPGRDIAKECGYPPTGELTVQRFMELYLRDGIAARVNDVFPDECWAVYPRIFQNKTNKDTPFEKAWEALETEVSAFSYMHRADRLAGIGRYGVLFLGLDDVSGPADLTRPVVGIDEDGRPVKTSSPAPKLLYLRAFSEDCAPILSAQTNPGSRRCTEPLLYNLNFSTPSGGNVFASQMHQVHWSRVVHIADNRLNSEIIGVPRMQKVLNYLLDLIKIGGGSAEMFWKGAFPGYSFETIPELLGESTVDEESLKEQFAAYSNGLKRYLALDGMTAKPLWPQTADPTAHAAHQLLKIAATIGVPLRIFLGSEAGDRASASEVGTHNKRIAHRQRVELTPHQLRPVIDRLVTIRVLPKPVDGYGADWDDLNSLSDADKAGIALQRSQALMQYVSSGAYRLVRPLSYLTRFLGYTSEEAEAMVDEAGGEASIMAALDKVVIPPAPAATSPQGGGRKGNAPRRKPGRPGGNGV